MNDDRGEFVARLARVFSFESKQSEIYTRFFQIDGITIEIAAESNGFLEKMTMALEHVAAPRGNRDPDLRIELYFGPRPDFFDWVHRSFGDQVQRLQAERYMCIYSPGVDGNVPTLSFFDTRSKRAIFWIENDERTPWYEIAVPFRIIFHWFFDRHGLTMVHGASIGNGNSGVLLIGKGGSGKTSTALAALRHPGLVYVSDDYVLVKMDPAPTAISLYSTAKIKHHELASIGEKEVLFLHETHSKKIAKRVVISAVILPVIMHAQKTTWWPMHRSAALLALAPSTIFQLLPEDTHHDSFAVLVELIKSVPSFQLQLGANMEEIAEKLALLLQGL